MAAPLRMLQQFGRPYSADPGQTGSLAANSNLLIDTTPPITAVVSSSTNGSYGIDAVIDITVGFQAFSLTHGGKQHSSSKPAAPIDALLSSGSGSTHSPSNTPLKPAIPPQISISSPQRLSNSMAAPSMTLRVCSHPRLAAPGETGSLGDNAGW